MVDKELKKSVMDVNNGKINKVKMKISIKTLEHIISFLYKDTKLKTHKALKQIEKFISFIDLSIYQDNPEILNRIWIIKNTIDAIIIHRFEHTELIIEYCKGCEGIDQYKEDMLDVLTDGNKISYEESKHLLGQICDRINYGYVVNLRKLFNDYLDRIDDVEDDGVNTCRDRFTDLCSLATTITNIKRKNTILDTDDNFSLADDEFEPMINDLMEKLKNKNKIFRTGIKNWNTILAPGYMSKRLYMYLAFPGGGKSQILLKSALDIRKYNTEVETKDPNKRPAVLFITMENSVEETIERIFNMTVTNDDIRNYTSKQVIRKLREDGGLKLTEKNNIDIIIKYYKNREIDTNDLYTIIDDYNDNGIEVVALILDYVKRIRPAEKASSEKEELKNITNELKSLASMYEIPVITAQQLNRSASTIIENALQSNKKDVGKLIGRDGVAGAWEIMENSDWVCVLNQEKVKIESRDGTEMSKLFMSFKLLKRRYKSNDSGKVSIDSGIEYFNHPYDSENNIMLLDDLYEPKSLSVKSLSNLYDTEAFDKRGKKNAVSRGAKSTGFESEFPAFDFDQTMN